MKYSFRNKCLHTCGEVVETCFLSCATCHSCWTRSRHTTPRPHSQGSGFSCRARLAGPTLFGRPWASSGCTCTPPLHLTNVWATATTPSWLASDSQEEQEEAFAASKFLTVTNSARQLNPVTFENQRHAPGSQKAPRSGSALFRQLRVHQNPKAPSAR